ncbi:MAG TPA: hypothetical protein VNK95_08555, partial [Caldilineaceae bacterium]|nr:hypothetical protein [Caldilineaceae bacterium]
MEREEARRLVEETFYRSLGESGVSITAVPEAQLRAIVRSLADSVFAVIEGLEGEEDALSPQPAPAAADAATAHP